MQPYRAAFLLACLLLVFTPPSPQALNWGNPFQLTNNAGIADADPVISTDGTRIAYQAIHSSLPGSEIFAINPDGSANTRLTSNSVSDFRPSISGDGSIVVFFSNLDSDFEIYKVRSDGSGLTQLTFNERHIDSFPVISGDGSTIAFQSNRTGNLDIFAMGLDGMQLRQLTSSAARDEAPSISADGSKVAYVSNVTQGGEIFVVGSDGLQPPLRLTFNSCIERSPRISGDGNWVVFQSDCGGDWEIMLIRSDGSDPRQLTNNFAADRSPSITYDGSLIAYVSNQTSPNSPEGDDEIYVVNSDGTHIDQLTFNSASDLQPSVDGSGTVVVYQSDIDGQDTELFLVRRASVRDVAVMSVEASPTLAVLGQTITITVVVKNEGDVSENFNVTAYSNSTIVGTQTVSNLGSGDSQTLSFYWNTTAGVPGTYTIKAVASTVTGENDTVDNTKIDGTVTVTSGGGGGGGGGRIYAI